MVPNGWSLVKLGDVLTLGSGDTKPTDLQKELSDDSPYPVYGGNNIMGYSSQKNSSDSVILIGRVGEYCGVTRYIDKACWITDNALYTKSVSSDIDKEYLVSKLKKFDLSRLRNKGGQPLVSQKPIYAVKLPMPPLPEQRKIVKILSTWDKAINTTEKLIETSKQQKKALMQQLLTGKKRFKDENDNIFPSWTSESIGQYLVPYKELVPVNTDIPVLTSSRTGLYVQERSVINEGDYGVLPLGYFTYRHMSDDLIFKFNVNRTWKRGAVSKEYPVFKTVGLDSYFLESQLNEGSDFKQFAIQQKQGGTRTRLYFKNLKELKLNLPCLAEQQKIASVLISADKEIEALKAKLDHFKQEKKALMQQLLTGKRRVNVE
ncbi:restriction endonuclease subunit S [Vibrio splendidus]|uniref:restriction endonuclease subunit S n=1 Tax=Vibrio splendidus TaxID=29497 RepID=UPI000C82DF5B|nr:restriction endonuclease subunit S [Vibrio splendidus]PMP43061.1 hypothetical protein BCS86_01960 [Vibrio splendidus]